MNDKEELKLLTEQTAARLGLVEAYVVEKDFYVTQALHAVSDLENDYFHLIFQGGTCLSKAHRLIQRMSEDCDLRIQETDEGKALGKEGKRKRLREFRHELLARLEKQEFIIPEHAVRTRNEGQYMQVNLQFDSLFATSKGLRPHVQMEFVLGEVKLVPEKNRLQR